MTGWRSVVIETLLVMGCASSSRSNEATAYVIRIEVQGSPAAFANRTIRIGRHTAPSATGTLEPVEGTLQPVAASRVTLCTLNRQKFLDEPIPFVVLEADRTVSQGNISRVACKFSEEKGILELNYVFLTDDGMLVSDFSNDRRTFSSCNASVSPKLCPNPDF